MKYDVFISYSTEDKIIAEGICGYLESNKVRCFVAWRDIKKGEDWAQKIPQALRSCRMMIAVFSNAFNISDQTDNELHVASRHKLPILTFRITDDDFEGAKEYFLSKSNWIEAFPEPEKMFGELLKSVNLLLGLNCTIDASSPSSSKPFPNKTKDILFVKNKLTDPLRSFYLLRKADEDGDMCAAYWIAMCYFNGWGTEQNWNKAREWLSKASWIGHARSIYRLATMYHQSKGVRFDSIQALGLYTTAAKKGDGLAMKKLGQVYHTGELGLVDEIRSESFFNDALNRLEEQSFDENDDEAMYELGESYRLGTGVVKSYVMAVEWYKRAISCGNIDAMNMLGVCYEKGWGVVQNNEQALQWLTRASDGGNRCAQYNIAQIYFNDDKHPDVVATGRELLLHAAQGGNDDAQLEIAHCFEYGKNGYDINHENAMFWYRCALEGGSVPALYCYAVRVTNEVSPSEIFSLYKQASVKGFLPAYFHLCQCYALGLGTEQNLAAATRWLDEIEERCHNRNKDEIEGLYCPSCVWQGRFDSFSQWISDSVNGIISVFSTIENTNTFAYIEKLNLLKRSLTNN